jgi:hypothetical protein
MTKKQHTRIPDSNHPQPNTNARTVATYARAHMTHTQCTISHVGIPPVLIAPNKDEIRKTKNYPDFAR